MFNPTPTQTARQVLNRLLDRGYTQQAGAVVNAMTRNVASGAVATRLVQLEAEAQRLNEAGQPMTQDNPVLRAVMADLDDVLTRNRMLIDGAAEGLQDQGVRAAATAARDLSLPGISNAQLVAVGVSWRTPDPEAVAELINIANSPAWAAELERYADGVLAQVRDIAIRGIVNGRNPLQVARDVRDAVNTIPASRAQALMRTLQLTSYRRGVGLNYQANRDILRGHRRVAALDSRCCLACVALHGTELRLDEVVVDHHNGRCTSIAIVRGFERFSNVESGEAWYARQPEDVQLSLAGPGAYEALRSGRAQLRDFVQSYTDPVFGDMVREGSLRRLGL